MLKKTFLLTTALVLCVSTALAAPNPEQARERMLERVRTRGTPVIVRHGIPVTVMVPGKATPHPQLRVAPYYGANVTFNNLANDKDDANTRFISWYAGATRNSSSCYSSSNFHSCLHETANHAIPVTGLGYRARKIKVPIYSFYSSAEFNVGIYSATASGLPGSELAGASTTAGSCSSGLCTVPVDIKLKAGQEYFVEVACGKNSGNCDGGWDFESRDWSREQHDYWYFKERRTYNYGSGTHTSSHSTPWHLSTYFPTEPAAKIY